MLCMDTCRSTMGGSRILMCGLLLVLCTGCVGITTLTPVHVPQPPTIGPGTGTDADPFTANFTDIKNVKPPVPIYTPEAEYPWMGRRKKERVTLEVGAVVTKEGTVRDAHLITTCGDGFDENALKAVQTYRFKPATLNGQPVAMRIMVEIGFTIY